MKAGLYARVSTDRQTVENQLAELRQLAQARGFEPVVYEEVESAAKARPVFDRLLADVRAGRVNGVAVWALDRLHRSMMGAIQTVLECDRLGVPVLSVRETWLDTSGPVRPLLVAIFGRVAEQERARLIERTCAGIERARRSGTKSGRPIGRPPSSPILLRAAADRIRDGEPRSCGRSRSRALRSHRAPVPVRYPRGETGGAAVAPRPLRFRPLRSRARCVAQGVGFAAAPPRLPRCLRKGCVDYYRRCGRKSTQRSDRRGVGAHWIYNKTRLVELAPRTRCRTVDHQNADEAPIDEEPEEGDCIKGL
jgi:DNA invertase Pin-like site-specific DNA recombinase